MLDLLRSKGAWAFAQKSHVYEAVSLAASSETLRHVIVRKLVDHVLGEDGEDDRVDVIDSVGEGDIDPELHSSVTDRFRSLIANPPDEQNPGKEAVASKLPHKVMQGILSLATSHAAMKKADSK